jgi:hypothetical protein
VSSGERYGAVIIQDHIRLKRKRLRIAQLKALIARVEAGVA